MSMTTNGGIGSRSDCANEKLLNPFVHHLELDTTYEKIKTALLTIILLPIRVVVICCFLVAGWLVATAGLWGMKDEEIMSKPLTGWRSRLKLVSAYLIRFIFVIGGIRLKVSGGLPERHLAPVVALAPHSSFVDSLAMVYMGGPSIVAKGETSTIPFFGNTFVVSEDAHNADLEIRVGITSPFKPERQLVPVVCFFGKVTCWAGGMYLIMKGKKAPREVAPILVIAPHSTFLDAGIIYSIGSPSIIAKRDNENNKYITKLINFTQPIYVFRDDPNSRQNTIKEIIKRATSKLDWPQILIFPEGTCTNRSCLITFKPGAFYPGVPVQPVCIRYPNKIDTVTWTWDGLEQITFEIFRLKLLWLTLTRPYSYCEIEFLPVYVPDEQEKKDPKLYANNVRKVMAKALGIPVSDYTYDDCKLLTRAKEMNLPQASSIVDLQKLRHSLGMANTIQEEALINSTTNLDLTQVAYNDFVNLLNIPPMELSSRQLFSIYNKNNSGLIDFREYLLGVLAINCNTPEALKVAFRIYDRSGQGRLRIEDFRKAVCHTLALTEDTATDVFYHVDKNKLGYITHDSFLSYVDTRHDLTNLLYRNKEEKFIRKHGQFCPTENTSKKRD
ncbi:hypothetical protein WA026_014985 [Henosepilachna vigintioctopunctata]|uniref:EF-hand domain-containing protein n=1 Tax=Henosepilachna vigintioctopunctata TaxID=420089 RepID=A0AAW1TYW0_9CUCU